jgi:hypothetical protein
MEISASSTDNFDSQLAATLGGEHGTPLGGQVLAKWGKNGLVCL